MSMHDSAPVNLPAQLRAILALSATGQTASEIAAALQLSADDIHAHLSRAIHALGARSKLEAILTALQLGLIRIPSSLQCDILRVLAGDTTLMGTTRTLAHSLRVSGKDLRAALRDLLESGLIAVYGEPGGHLIIRLERRVSPTPPAAPPAIERRRPGPDIRLL